jgi:hypothetical protein
MIIIHNYFAAISLTIVAMIACGSWANTQSIFQGMVHGVEVQWPGIMLLITYKHQV